MRGQLITRTWEWNPRQNAPAKYRRACRYDAFIPDALQGEGLQIAVDTAGLVAEAEGAIRELNARARPALAPLARLLLRTESIASSKVEGMQMGARELARAEAKMETGARTGSTAREIIANIDAMQLAIDEATSVNAFAVEEIRSIHRMLMEQAPNAQVAGQIRTVQNWIGGNDYDPCGADFVPPPPEYVADLLGDLCAAIDDDVLPPLVQAALVHAQFETIHPFDDGNGRTGRALIHVVLRRRGVAPAYVPPISVALASARDRYIRGLTDFREGRVEAWLEHFAGAAASAAQLASDYLDAVGALVERWKARLSGSKASPRSDAAAWVVIDNLPAHPIITAPVAAAVTGRSRPQIYRALSQLTDAGVLEPISESRRNRAWEAVGLLELLEGLEAGRRL